jgi:hypothetical protein
MVILATLLLTSAPSQVESGLIVASACMCGCKVMLGGCLTCGVGAIAVSGGAAAPVAGWYCSIAYTACTGACVVSAVTPTP